MARMEYFLVASDVSIDQLTNRVSVFNILEEITIASLPWRIDHLVALSLWCKQGPDDTEHQVEIEITNAGKSHKFRARLELQRERQRLAQHFDGITVEGWGDLRFTLRLDGEHAATHVVTIRKQDT